MRAYSFDDIEAPRFMDIDIYENNEIQLFLKRKLIDNKVDEVRSFLEINKKIFHEAMINFLDYICTDEDTGQYLRAMSENLFFIIENNNFNTINIVDYTEQELENYVSSYYSEGLSQIKKDYGKDWKQIVAEIISETNS